MQIITVSRATLSGGKELAERLAQKLGYRCVCREEIIEAATREGIQVGRLEMAMLKPSIFGEKLALEKEHYLAFTASYLCEKAREGPLVYHGRTGHLVLAGIDDILKVRVLADREYRLRSVMLNLGLDRHRAERYIDQVDEDRKRWVQSMYGVPWEDASRYDVIINLANMSVENAAAALVSIAQLPDFQMSPAAHKALDDLFLASRARVMLARDERTHGCHVKVRADRGVVTVTYLPQDAAAAAHIASVLEGLDGVTEIRATMATTNILWIQEEFSPESSIFDQVVEIATKWNAAVELVRLVPGEPKDTAEDGAGPAQAGQTGHGDVSNGGIEDDEPEHAVEDGGLRATLDALARLGRSGGGRVVCGDQARVIDSIDRSAPYSLVVLGDLFLDKGHAAKQRLTREFRAFMGEKLHTPVVTADEIGEQYLFGKRDVVRMLGYGLATLAVFLVVFAHQDVVLQFLARQGWFPDAVKGTFLEDSEWLQGGLVSVAVFLSVPIVAYLYGSLAGLWLKWIKME